MKNKNVMQLAIETAKLIEKWENVGEMSYHYQSVFEDLLSTIQMNAIDNQVTITNVELFVREWRKEFYGKENEQK